MALSIVNVRVNSQLKQDASRLFEELGLNLSTAINIFLKQSVISGGLPFRVNSQGNKVPEGQNEEIKHVVSDKC